MSMSRPPSLLRAKDFSLVTVWPAGATPKAGLAIFRGMLAVVEDLATLPYPGCAHLTDATTAAVAPRYFSVRAAAATTHLAVVLQRRWNTTGATTPKTTLDGNDGAAEAWITIPGPVPGTLDVAGTSRDMAFGSTKPNDAAILSTDRPIKITYALAPTLRTGCHVDNCAGWTLYASDQHDDLMDAP